ncbi:hypothetical protein KP788_11605 [Streptococcus equi subsp. equi]|uniref:hypothetical protein n=1 Tax=Streptococcus equi TaxID=1336 RepID=UPI001E439391|nr:hypothetical protein [Streptococcus equi]MCD3499302.1 hypothetical protein [Streptococcus equi subsp. equi]
MEKEFNTLTYGKLPLQIDMGHGKLIPKELKSRLSLICRRASHLQGFSGGLREA